MLDSGNRGWLEELREKKLEFAERVAEANRLVRTVAEKKILVDLEAVYRQYDAKREEVVALYDRGDVAGAKKTLLGDVNALFARAYALGEDFVAANAADVSSRTAQSERGVQAITGMVGLSVVLTVGLGAALLWLFFHGVLLPLRRMAADARVFTGQAPVEAEEGRSDELGVVGDYLRTLMSDMTDARSTLEHSRRQLVSAEKLASVGKLAASVAHEIRNPLTTVKMWLFAIRRAVEGNAELDGQFEIVSEELNRVEDIVHNFLEFSRPPDLKLRPQCVSALLDKSLKLVHHHIEEREVTVKCEVAPDLPDVMADSEQFKQVLINLLNNALDALPEGGTLRLQAAAETDPGGRSMVVVRIQNDGPGMPDDVRQRVFEPFFTTKENGTGLGLCIAAGIMARHQGRLVLEPPMAEGTSFAVWTPVARTENL
jgi:signal transduction histidine kinase